jgi:ubiquinone/menaquinone biosynthesis C-methylase UbiE
MGFYADHVLPRCIDFVLSRKHILELRARVASQLAGEVLEVGFGSGLNLPYYPRAVTRALAVDPSEVGRKLAQKRIAQSPFPVEWCGLDGESLALPSASVDAVLSTFTFCTIPNLQRALAELRRVLKPEGTLHFLEHGRSPEPRVAKWQDRLNPCNRVLAGGCNINRAIDREIADAGFELAGLQRYYLPGPKVAAHMFEGRARIASH